MYYQTKPVSVEVMKLLVGFNVDECMRFCPCLFLEEESMLYMIKTPSGVYIVRNQMWIVCWEECGEKIFEVYDDKAFSKKFEYRKNK